MVTSSYTCANQSFTYNAFEKIETMIDLLIDDHRTGTG